MSSLPYLKFYAADWLADPKVRTLTLEERGFYLDLLLIMWVQKPGYKTARNLSVFARNFGISRAKVERILSKIQAKLGQSLLVSEDWIESPRLRKEAGRAQDISEKRSEAGKQGGRPKKANAFEGEKPNIVIVEAEAKVDTKEEPPIAPQGGNLQDERFDQFWSAYPKKTGKGAAKKAWAKINPSAALLQKILTALEWQTKSEQWTKDRGQFIPNPATYLNQERWEDEPPVISRSSPLSAKGLRSAANMQAWLEENE